MDMSKLPRMSQTPAPPPLDPPQHDYRSQPPLDYSSSSGTAEAWISIAIGVILLLAYPYTWQWLLSLISSYKPPFLPITDTATGNEIPYPRSIFFFSHLSVFSFGLVLIIDGLVLFTRRVALTMAALVLTCAVTGWNLLYVLKAVMAGEGLPIISALAVAFGVYIAIQQRRRIMLLRNFGRSR